MPLQDAPLLGSLPTQLLDLDVAVQTAAAAKLEECSLATQSAVAGIIAPPIAPELLGYNPGPAAATFERLPQSIQSAVAKLVAATLCPSLLGSNFITATATFAQLPAAVKGAVKATVFNLVISAISVTPEFVEAVLHLQSNIGLFAAAIPSAAAADFFAVGLLHPDPADPIHVLAHRAVPLLDKDVAAAVWQAIETASAAPPGAQAAAMAALTCTAADPVSLSRLVQVALFSAAGTEAEAAAPYFDSATGNPNAAVFLSQQLSPPDPARVRLVAMALFTMLSRECRAEQAAWIEQQKAAEGKTDSELLTALKITCCINDHLIRFVDTALGLQQNQPDLQSMAVPDWYEAAFVTPVLDVLDAELEHRKGEAVSNSALIKRCQALATDSLDFDRQLYVKKMREAEDACNVTVVAQLKALAREKEAGVKMSWPRDPDTNKPEQQAIQPGVGDDATKPLTTMQRKLQALQDGATFRGVVDKIGTDTKLVPTMVRGRRNSNAGLIVKLGRGEVPRVDDYFLSKATYRIGQKRWIRGGSVVTICDVNRAMLEAHNIDQLLGSLQAIFGNPDITIVDFKDRINNPSDGGWCDLVILFVVDGSRGHMNELQIVLSPLLKARADMDAHAEARHFIELLLKCGHKFDATPREAQLERDNKQLKHEKERLERDLAKGVKIGQVLAGWMQKRGSGKSFLGRKTLKNRWFVLKGGWFTYHDGDSKAGADSSLPQRLKSALGGMDGPLELAECVIAVDPVDEHKFTIKCGADRELSLDKYDGNAYTPAMLGKVHSRQAWIDAMLTHTGCRLAE